MPEDKNLQTFDSITKVVLIFTQQQQRNNNQNENHKSNYQL